MTDPATSDEPFDENLWLEQIHDERALAWARDRTAEAEAAIGDVDAAASRLLEVLDSDERIPFVSKRGEHYYNLWRDREHPRGLWRRTTLGGYLADDIAWQLLLDIDALGATEGTEWVWAGSRVLPQDLDRALVRLSPDGGDAVVVREFDLTRREFVDPDGPEQGFALPVAKSRVAWASRDELLVATDTGEGSLTSSSYPRQLRRWRRGTPLDQAPVVHEVDVDAVSISGWRDRTPGFEQLVVEESLDFWRGRTLVERDGALVPLALPEDAFRDVHGQWVLVLPHSDWAVAGEEVRAGELVALPIAGLLAGHPTLVRVVDAGAHGAVEDWAWTRHRLLVTVLEDVASRILVVDPADWSSSELVGVPALSSVHVTDTDADDSDEFWLTATGFTQPTTLLRGAIGETPEVVKRAPAFFDGARFEVTQHHATSDDGTRVPYFQVAPSGIAMDGSHRVLLDGYGGFLHSMLPAYSGVTGRGWLERGGVYVLANIRGGGEFGPRWHTAALRENRHRAYEDFAAVARDLVERGVTVPARLACEGRSNGGLLVGNMLTQYPELFGAVLCGVPLLDMRRYTRLSAGASWIAEYGDPDVPEDWEFIRTFSPYHLLRNDVAYPPVLFYAATSDDRVGPVQARKMAARMSALPSRPGAGPAEVLYLENDDGGHGGAVDNTAQARLYARMHEFAWSRLG